MSTRIDLARLLVIFAASLSLAAGAAGCGDTPGDPSAGDAADAQPGDARADLVLPPDAGLVDTPPAAPDVGEGGDLRPDLAERPDIPPLDVAPPPPPCTADGECDDGVACTLDECLPGAGCRHTPVDARCVDADPCTEGGCDPAAGCVQAPLSGVPCSDGNPCTADDTCAVGVCVGGPNACACAADADCPAPDDPCVGRLVCDLAGATGPHHTCRVDPDSVAVCDPAAAAPCQEHVCERTAPGGCALRPLPDGTPCADGDPCTEDACLAGACVPGESLCECATHEDCPQPTNACDPHRFCDVEGAVGPPRTCQTVPGSLPDPAYDLVTCTEWVCDREAQSWFTLAVPMPDGAACDDRNVCTEEDRCQTGVCVPRGLRDCDDDDPNTHDGCDPRAGCWHAPVVGDDVDPPPCRFDSDCDDGNPCTAVDLCLDGRCVAAGPLCPCWGDAECAALAAGGRCAPTFVCDRDGRRGGPPENCVPDRSAIPDCEPGPDGNMEGIVATCLADEDHGGPCAYRVADGSQLLGDLQAIYRGAAVHYARADRLDRDGHPVGRTLPAFQDITPVEGTCCVDFGGTDTNNDDRCDWTTTYWDTETWEALGFRSLGRRQAWVSPWDPTYDGNPWWGDPHEFLYAFAPLPDGRFEVTVYEDVDCVHACQHRYTLRSGPANPTIGVTRPPETIEHALVGECPAEWGPGIGPIPLTPTQTAGFADPPLPPSLNPYYAEAVTTLQRLLEGAVAYYERQPADACAFPYPGPYGAYTSVEFTCCAPLGGPDDDGDGLCDVLNAVPELPWADLDFDLAPEVAFVYRVVTVTDADGLRFEARAYGDLDCDFLQSTFVRFARPVESADGCAAAIVPGMYVEREVE